MRLNGQRLWNCLDHRVRRQERLRWVCLLGLGWGLTVSIAAFGLQADAAATQTTTEGSCYGQWRSPLEPTVRVVRNFDPPAKKWQTGHRGIDLAASAGQRVLAPASAQVRFAGKVGGKSVLSLWHCTKDGKEIISSYEPVVTDLSVGQQVSAGQALATVPTNHHCPAFTCLHWSVFQLDDSLPGTRTGRVYQNPLLLLDNSPIGQQPRPGKSAELGGEGDPGREGNPGREAGLGTQDDFPDRPDNTGKSKHGDLPERSQPDNRRRTREPARRATPSRSSPTHSPSSHSKIGKSEPAGLRHNPASVEFPNPSTPPEGNCSGLNCLLSKLSQPPLWPNSATQPEIASHRRVPPTEGKNHPPSTSASSSEPHPEGSGIAEDYPAGTEMPQPALQQVTVIGKSTNHLPRWWWAGLIATMATLAGVGWICQRSCQQKCFNTKPGR